MTKYIKSLAVILSVLIVITSMQTLYAAEVGDEIALTNAGFEDESEGFAAGWAFFKNDKGYVTLEKNPDNVHTGKNSVKLTSNVVDSYPWARQGVNGLIPGAEYTISIWLKFAVSGTYAFKFEHYSGDKMTGQEKAEAWSASNNTWTQYTTTFVVPNETNKTSIYIRLWSSGTIYCDDISLKMTKAPNYLTTFMTDNIFYYTEWEGYGIATATANVDYYPELVGKKVEFKFRDGDVSLSTEKIAIDENGTAEFKFDLSLLKVKRKGYFIDATYYNDKGKAEISMTETIYKYDRPTYLKEDGSIEMDGKVIDPVYAYHVRQDNLEDIAKCKINAIQGYADEEFLNKAYKNGIYSMVVLYANGKSAGHSDRINSTISSVTKFKDHPGVLCWMIMDEPKNDPATMEDLCKAYKTIRDIDPHHPVFVNLNDNFYILGRYADIISIDNYPAGLTPFTTDVTRSSRKALSELNYRKPVYNILQAFHYRETFPTANEFRSMIYQALWEGIKGIGYFCWLDSKPGVDLIDTELGDPLISLGDEYKIMFDYFSHGKYPTFTEQRNDNAWWKGWVKDGEIYLAIMNRKQDSETAVEIPLESFDKSIVVNGYTAVPVNGAAKEAIIGDGSVLKLTLEKAQAPLYRITPKTPINISTLKDSRFIDLYDYPWARIQIANLDEKGIINSITNNKFAPGEKITRADFAMFLIRTLGIKSNTKDNFSDVDPDAYYASEIGAGKKLGLLNGSGDGTFNPEAEISRQDMMTICARGMRYAGKLGDNEVEDLNKFTDSQKIADYAVEAVSAMVSKKIVLGNADGTINPLGNATRAEAAVIMYRILTS